MTKEYSADSIKVLDSLQHIRLRKGMYIGDATDARSLLSEIFDNAIDEVQAGFSSELVINVDTKNINMKFVTMDVEFLMARRNLQMVMKKKFLKFFLLFLTAEENLITVAITTPVD